MSRTFSPGSLVRLPRLTAISAARLSQELLNAANAEKKLPATIAADREELAEAHEALQIELVKRVTGEGQETPQVRAADAVEDNAFGALHDWLAAWTRLPADQHPEASQAGAVLQGMFPSGLSFLAIRPADEWQEAEVRLRLLREKGYDETVAELGGEPFLDHVKAAHKSYGEALGITAVKRAPETPAIQGAREAALDAIRAYVLRVAAHVRKKDPHTAELAERLLAPLRDWKDAPMRAGSVDAPPAPAAPDAGASPS